MSHAIRFSHLLLHPRDALQIVHLLIRKQYFDQALLLLDVIEEQLDVDKQPMKRKLIASKVPAVVSGLR